MQYRGKYGEAVEYGDNHNVVMRERNGLGEARWTSVYVRLTEEERYHIREAAKSQGLTLAGFLRAALINEVAREVKP